MNDETEYKSGYEVIREVLDDFGLKDHDVVNEMSEDNLNKTFQILIACFSRNGDLKSQWVEYAEASTGVSIGFDEHKVKQFNMFNRFIENGSEPISEKVDFISVNYDEAQLRSCAQAIIEKHITSQSPIKWVLLSRSLMHLSISYKDCFFSEEDEVRAFVTLESAITDRYKIEQRDTKYGRANYHRLITSYQQLQSIEEVIVGPKSTISVKEVDLILSNAGINGALVRKSAATGIYR